jgi:phosphatidylserine/phosphatidylglycerophosphate/cardiolipin synthase-like enzyme
MNISSLPIAPSSISPASGSLSGGVYETRSSQFQTQDWIEKLKDAGLETTDHLRIQANVHNKGITVDSEVAMVSSQNWSPEGTLRNRDAGIIIYNTEAAAYFEQIFLHDWAYLASAKISI